MTVQPEREILRCAADERFPGEAAVVEEPDEQVARGEWAGGSREGESSTSYRHGKMRAMATATRLTTKGQVVIPKAVRERLRWAPGTELAVEEVGTRALRLSPLEIADPIDRLYGCLRAAPRDPLVELEAEHRAEIEVDEHRQRRGR